MGYVIPMLVCRDVAAEIEFCCQAFAAVELSRRPAADGGVIHATLQVGPALVMVHDEQPHLASRAPEADGSSPVVVYLYCDAVDPVMEQAAAAGARVLLAAQDQPWGDRVGRIMDPAGHVWNIAARIQQQATTEANG